jgi:hypothetical protein
MTDPDQYAECRLWRLLGWLALGAVVSLVLFR